MPTYSFLFIYPQQVNCTQQKVHFMTSILTDCTVKLLSRPMSGDKKGAPGDLINIRAYQVEKSTSSHHHHHSSPQTLTTSRKHFNLWKTP